MAADLLTVREIAAQLRVCRATIYRLIASGKLPAIRIGSSVRVRRGLVDQLEASLRCTS